MKDLYLPKFASTDAVVTLLCESAEDYAPRPLVKRGSRKSISVSESNNSSTGTLLEFNAEDPLARYERVDVLMVIMALLYHAHVTYAVTKIVERATGSGFSKNVRCTFFDLLKGKAASSETMKRDLAHELLRFVGRSLWTVEVYRNPRADMPGKTGYQIRLRGRVPFRDAAGNVPLVWPRNAAGVAVKDGEKVPMEASYMLHLPGQVKAEAAA